MIFPSIKPAIGNMNSPKKQTSANSIIVGSASKKNRRYAPFSMLNVTPKQSDTLSCDTL